MSRQKKKIAAGMLGVGALQLFIVQGVVAQQWSPPYNWLERTISDLGNTSCGQFAIHGETAFVCSPLHGLMNGSMIVSASLGIIAGIVLLSAYGKKPLIIASLLLFIVANICALFVGIFPEDINAKLHLIGALNLPLSSIAFLLFGSGIRSKQPRLAAWVSMIGVLGVLGSVGLMIAQGAGSSTVLGSVPGLTERLISYPPKLFFVVMAIVVLFRTMSAKWSK